MPEPEEARHFVSHPKYGDVPLVPHLVTLADGRVHQGWRYDPAYAPPLPRGAVRGDITRQVYCCDFPQYWYEDLRRTCVQCRKEFTFHAAEQKFWYETMQFNFASTAVRCLPCRKQRRTDRAVHEQLAAAVHAAAAAPADPLAQLALGEATAAFVERFGHGKIDRGLAAVRRARRTPGLVPAHFWEGELQRLAGRPDKARAAYTTFLDLSKGSSPRLEAAARRALATL